MTLQASGGCTSIKGRYGVSGAAIAIRLRALKENDCAEQTTIVQLAMVDGLRKATSFEVVRVAGGAADKLVLRSATGVELLRFGLDDIDALGVADWRLTRYTVDGLTSEASVEPPAVLSFRLRRDNPTRRTSSGRATGSSGCNGVVAQFYRSADVLSFGELQRTDAPCTPRLADQEAAMVAVLDATSLSLSLPPDRLILTSTDTGDSLEFSSQRPLEGTTWLLEPGPWMRRSGGAVTLRLGAGTATGEGPCGPYRATYATDGRFITFADIEGAGVDACSDSRSETSSPSVGCGGRCCSIVISRSYAWSTPSEA